MTLLASFVVLSLSVGGNCWTHSPTLDPSSSTRLVGSGVPWEGRLEVYYAGEWGAVCSNGFDWTDASVACYSMGYGRNGREIGGMYSPATGRIWLDWVGCMGHESWIGECSNSGWGQVSCGQWSVISVSCPGGTSETILPPSTVAYDTATAAGPTRLVGSGYPDRGRVEVFYNGVWGTVCDDSFDDVDASVVCSSLGYGRIGRAVYYEYANGYGQIWLDDVQCYGYESFIGDCGHNGWGVHNCGHSEDVGVECDNSTDSTATVDSSTAVYYTGDPASVTRLVGSGWSDRGRVEVLNVNTWQWGTVCKDNFDDTDARVVCYSLGYGYNGQFIGNTYGQGSGPIWLDEVRCVGTETFIGNCPHNGWGNTDCGHYEDVSVECYSSSPSTAAWPAAATATTESPARHTTGVDAYWSTRLVGSGVSWEGRLEVLYNGQWGAVCSNSFSDVDARVACNSLGYGYTGHYIGSPYTPATYVWLDYVNCAGWESWIGYCPHNGWGYTSCNVWSVASVSCVNTATTESAAATTESIVTTPAEERWTEQDFTVNPYYSTRLVGSGMPWEGRLEVLYGGQWGAVCSNSFSDVDARVACNSLGYGYTGQYIGNQYTPASYIWLDYVNCYGWESWIGYCPHNGWGYTSCSSWNVVSIRCLDATTETTAGETTTLTTAPQPYTVDPYWYTRLVGSGMPTEGRLEVLYGGQWGAVCSNSFSDVDARVACNSLGYGFTGQYIGNVYTPASYIWLDYVNCGGWESWIGYCPHNGWGYTTCGTWGVVSIRCSDTTATEDIQTTTTTMPPSETTATTDELTSQVSAAAALTVDPYWSTRLVGSINPWEGRLEVLYNGQWGAVCSNWFSDVDARVACNSLGYGYTGQYIGNQYTPASYIWLDYVNCGGWESWIGYCPHNGWGYTSCSSWNVVSISCLAVPAVTRPPTVEQTTQTTQTTTGNYYGATRLVGGYYSDRGRVEVLYNGVWGTVCDDSFDDTDARVVCNSLGYGYSGRYVGNLYGQGSGQIWLDEVRCSGYETAIGYCPHNGWGVHDCKHEEDVSVECFQATTAIKQDTTTTTTTTTTAGTSATTTASPGYPDITSPFMEESLAGLMEAVDGTMTMSCLHKYTQQFQEVLKGQLERAKQEMVASSTFCEEFSDGKLITAYINMLQSGVDVGLMFGVDVISYGTDTISSIETCGWQLGDYLSNFSNWRQPIWTDINQCPRLVFTSSQFNITEVAWKCHP